MKVLNYYSHWTFVMFLLYKLNILKITPYVPLLISAVFFVLIFIHQVCKWKPTITLLIVLFVIHYLPLYFIDKPISLTNSILLFIGTFVVYLLYIHSKNLDLIKVYKNLHKLTWFK